MRPPHRALTPKEVEVCRLIIKGYSAKEIARLSGMAARTVDQHCVNVKIKLRIRTRAQISAYLLISGIITMDLDELFRPEEDDPAS